MQNPKSLPIQLDKRFVRYALLAGAAIAAAKPAKASVITVVEPTPIDFTTGTHTLDVNGDGVIDYYFSGLSVAMGASATAVVVTAGSGGTFTYSFSGFDSLEVNNSGFDVAALGPGNIIGFTAADSFSAAAAMAEFTATGILFAGLAFYDTNGLEYFGFAEFDPGQLVGYAYQTVPYNAITTFDLPSVPEPSSLALLALGATGLEILRRKKASRS